VESHRLVEIHPAGGDAPGDDAVRKLADLQEDDDGLRRGYPAEWRS